jgi:16S rRNA (cytosine967-C5)-methyltransferase
LDRIADLLRPGGVLVYAVCSTEPEETQMVVQHFLNKHREFAKDDRPSPKAPGIAGLLAAGGWLHTEPHRHGTDGFFAVRLKRAAA